jgi:hypothetical protein
VQYAWSYPTDGSTGLRRTSTTHVDGTTVEAEAYDTTADDLLNRPTGRKIGTSYIFKDSYLGLGRVVEREYGHGTGTKWTLVGTDATNNDNYLRLDRMGRVDTLYVKDSSGTSLEGWAYRHDYASRLKARQSLMGGSGANFSETWVRDGLGRPTRHRRGYLSGDEITGSGIRLEECWKLTPASCILEYHGGSSDTCGAPGYTAVYNKANEMASRSGDGSYAGYLATGEQVVEGLFEYTYDAWGRLVREESSTTELAISEYNGLHQRAHRNTGSVDWRAPGAGGSPGNAAGTAPPGRDPTEG